MAKDGDEIEIAGVRLTSPDKVLYPEQSITKRQLAEYYLAVAEAMLPHVARRPITLVRCPTGRQRKCFYQRHAGSGVPSELGEVDIPGFEESGAYLFIKDAPGLVALVQMGVLEVHPWGARVDKPDRPDRVIFDLDPGQGIDWARLLEATALMKQMLDLLELESFLKTSGGKGLHVVVPLTPKEGYDEVKDFAREVVVHMARTIPQLFVAKSGAQNRVGRIFIDYLRNGTGATTVAAFSARARPGLGVSVPVAWSALESLASASQWNIFNVLEHLARGRADPWKAYAKTRQTLTPARKKMVSGSK